MRQRESNVRERRGRACESLTNYIVISAVRGRQKTQYEKHVLRTLSTDRYTIYQSNNKFYICRRREWELEESVFRIRLDAGERFGSKSQKGGRGEKGPRRGSQLFPWLVKR